MYGRSLHGNREISRLTTGRWPCGPHRGGDEPKPVMHEREKSDPAVVAVKPANKPVRAGAEPMEPRAGAEGNAEQDGMHRTPSRESVSHGLDRVRMAATTVQTSSPKVGAGCLNRARPVLCGGRSVMSVPTAISDYLPATAAVKAAAENPHVPHFPR